MGSPIASHTAREGHEIESSSKEWPGATGTVSAVQTLGPSGGTEGGVSLHLTEDRVSHGPAALVPCSSGTWSVRAMRLTTSVSAPTTGGPGTRPPASPGCSEEANLSRRVLSAMLSVPENQCTARTEVR